MNDTQFRILIEMLEAIRLSIIGRDNPSMHEWIGKANGMAVQAIDEAISIERRATTMSVYRLGEERRENDGS